jgi:hypothetical protein
VWALLLLVDILLLAAIAVQVMYLRTYAAQVTTATKVIMGLNITLLSALLLGLVWLTYLRAVS